MLNIIQVILFLGLPMGLAFYFGQFWLGMFWVLTAVALGVMEIVTVKQTGKTITQNYKAWRKENKGNDLIYKAGLLLAVLILIWHFS